MKFAAALLFTAIASHHSHAATFGRIHGPRYHMDCHNGCKFPCDETTDGCIRKMLRDHLITIVKR